MLDKEKEKNVKLNSFKVVKAFTLEKAYRVGESIELAKGKLAEKLLTNKFIK